MEVKSRFPLMMRTIAAVTLVFTLLFTVLYLRLRNDDLLTWAISFGTTAYHFLMRLLVGYVIPKVTHYDFDYHRPWFQSKVWESAFYQKLGIKNWKRKLPTYAPGQFSLKENTLYQVIQNMCGAEIVHEVIMVLSFLPLLTVPVFGSFPVFFITSLAAALFDSIFVMAQRFNRPRLIRLYEKKEAQTHE